MFDLYGLNRYVCDVYEDMRRLLGDMSANNPQHYLMKSLIEEAQVMSNRMEAALRDVKDLEQLHKEINNKKKELKELENDTHVSE